MSQQIYNLFHLVLQLKLELLRSISHEKLPATFCNSACYSLFCSGKHQSPNLTDPVPLPMGCWYCWLHLQDITGAGSPQGIDWITDFSYILFTSSHPSPTTVLSYISAGIQYLNEMTSYFDPSKVHLHWMNIWKFNLVQTFFGLEFWYSVMFC